MLTYTPLDLYVYNAAYSGALGGISTNTSKITEPRCTL